MALLAIASEDPNEPLAEALAGFQGHRVSRIQKPSGFPAFAETWAVLMAPSLQNQQTWMRKFTEHYAPHQRPLVLRIAGTREAHSLEGVRFRGDVELDEGSSARTLRKLSEALEFQPLPAFRIEWPSEDRACEDALEEVSRVLDRTPSAWMQRGRILAAVREAIRNALVHGNQRVPELDIQLNMLVQGDACSIEVIDAGAGFDAAAVLAGDGRMGRGFSVMRHAATSVSSSAEGRGVNLNFIFQKDGRGEVDDFELDFEDHLTLDDTSKEHYGA